MPIDGSRFGDQAVWRIPICWRDWDFERAIGYGSYLHIALHVGYTAGRRQNAFRGIAQGTTTALAVRWSGMTVCVAVDTSVFPFRVIYLVAPGNTLILCCRIRG
jgi:hypothetical protein